MQGVQNALKYLPMSKEQAADTITNAATLGMGKWKPAQTPTFAQTSLVNPLDEVHGGGIKGQSLPGVKNAVTGQYDSMLVREQNVQSVRSDLQYRSTHPEAAQAEY